MIDTNIDSAGDVERRWSAYDRPQPTFDEDLVRVGRGTRGGEYLRRFWQVIGASDEALRTPSLITVLGEELVLFRDGSNAVGLVYPRCAHRGTSLYFGRTEEHGIRCCYHGWLFDTDGTCLEQPLEPDGGRARQNFVQPSYPVEERYGLIFAYMGPPDNRPALPRYAHLEGLEPEERLVVDKTSLGAGGPVIADFNWFQHYENVADPFHVVMLHETFSGTQFVSDMGKLPVVEYRYTPRGIAIESTRELDEGRTLRRVTELTLPTGRMVPSPTLSVLGRIDTAGFMMPIDDTHFRIYNVFRVREGELAARASTRKTASGVKRWSELSTDERREHPGDYEAQSGQGTITWHSEDHLAATDRGVAMLRRLYRQQVQAVASGEDPQGVFYDPALATIDLEAGNYMEGES